MKTNFHFRQELSTSNPQKTLKKSKRAKKKKEQKFQQHFSLRVHCPPSWMQFFAGLIAGFDDLILKGLTVFVILISMVNFILS